MLPLNDTEKQTIRKNLGNRVFKFKYRVLVATPAEHALEPTSLFILNLKLFFQSWIFSRSRQLNELIYLNTNNLFDPVKIVSRNLNNQ